MKISIYIFILFFIYNPIYGQRIVLKPFDPAIEINAGYRLTQNGFYNQINSLNNFNANKPMFIIGIGISDNFARNRGYIFRKVTFNQIIPQNIIVNDTINTTIRGFIINAGAGFDLIRKSKAFHIYLGLGVNAGRIKLYQKDYINKVIPIITPKLTLQPTYFFNQFYVNLNIEYDYDFINSKWGNIGNNHFNDVTVKNLNYTSLTTTLGIGYLFHKQN